MAAKKTPKMKSADSSFDYKSIKSFEDACMKIELDPEALPEVSMIPEEFRKAIINCYKLYIIFKAINNGWIPDWNNWKQYKYFPWFRVLSSGSGFGFSSSLCDFVGTITGVGSRLCTDTSEKALYIGQQFGEEYAEFFLIRN
ncbi:MAG: hypothetical protein NTU51_10480 [Bacteroidetes bacterium]|nr:hypothetical protein [Bacteroidota bacterium]